MIKAEHVTKKFGSFCALKDLSCKIPHGCIYGVIGSNGAGKSTFLRLITGVYKADMGRITLSGQDIYENPEIKSKIMFIPDELFFLGNSSMNRMAKMYENFYAPRFDSRRFRDLTEAFCLNPKAGINTFSKGMKRQAAIVLGLSCRPEYIFFDESFDGLDPLIRNLVKEIITRDVIEQGATAIITSHSLRELEDTCDQLALLREGGIVFESDIQNLTTRLFKIQVAFSYPYEQSLFSQLNILNYQKRGSVASFIVRGDREETAALLRTKAPILLDVLPLSLEEVFIHEIYSLADSAEKKI